VTASTAHPCAQLCSVGDAPELAPLHSGQDKERAARHRSSRCEEVIIRLWPSPCFALRREYVPVIAYEASEGTCTDSTGGMAAALGALQDIRHPSNSLAGRSKLSNKRNQAEHIKTETETVRHLDSKFCRVKTVQLITTYRPRILILLYKLRFSHKWSDSFIQLMQSGQTLLTE
jgi:hypothetical protein